MKLTAEIRKGIHYFKLTLNLKESRRMLSKGYLMIRKSHRYFYPAHYEKIYGDKIVQIYIDDFNDHLIGSIQKSDITCYCIKKDRWISHISVKLNDGQDELLFLLL